MAPDAQTYPSDRQVVGGKGPWSVDSPQALRGGWIHTKRRQADLTFKLAERVERVVENERAGNVEGKEKESEATRSRVLSRCRDNARMIVVVVDSDFLVQGTCVSVKRTETCYGSLAWHTRNTGVDHAQARNLR